MIHNFIKEDHKQIKEDVQEMKSFVEQFEALKLERDALWIKTQEDEREINQLRDAVKEKTEQRDEAIRLATLFQTLYLRLGKAEDEHYNTLMVQGAAKSLAELKGLKFFGKEA